MTTRKRGVAIVVTVGLLAAAGTWWIANADGGNLKSFRTAPVDRGDLVETISATGTLEPEEVVDVGAQVAGMIQEFGKDVDNKTIDHGSRVEPGTILARIDDSLYREEVNQAKAQLAKSESRLAQMQAQVTEGHANVQRSEADLVQLRAKLLQAERDWKRTKSLVNTKAASAQEYDSSEAMHDTARAALAVGEAVLVQSQSAVDIRVAAVAEAKADVESARAALARAEKNLGYATIKSPISGVIIDRRVNVGQTVVASFNTPSLFLIAKDLTRLEIWVSVNEADIGRIRPGQKAYFTVDTYPGKRLEGKVEQVRLNAAMTQNVVSYTVVVSADNKDGSLLPYLTANVDFEIGIKTDVLTVPNGALRWKPNVDQVAPAAREAFEASLRESAREESSGHGIVWIQEGEFVRPIELKTGMSNGISTEVVEGNLAEGMKVVLGTVEATTAEAASSPFVPKFGPRKKAN
ncbi:MAG: efflux RND transporter periplasmic adaptor subunit [Planctomycetota bacterium]